MAHSKADVTQNRHDLEAAVQKRINIHRACIAALENALRAELMLSSVDEPPAGPGYTNVGTTSAPQAKLVA
jgi:hypothetical protein